MNRFIPKTIFCTVVLFILQAAYLFALDETQLSSKYICVLDANTGTIIYTRDADVRIAPASLTKLLSMYVAFQKIRSGELTLQESVTISDRAKASNQAPGSSLMFLDKGQSVTVHDLLLGLAVSSGNDAAIALAEHVAGSVPAFVELMNTTMYDLGLENSHFVEPSGISADNYTTAYDFAHFCYKYLKDASLFITNYHSVQSFTWPNKNEYVFINGQRFTQIEQKNRNGLLQTYNGINGLKTGYIDESGYNFAVSAQRDEDRFIAVLLGISADTSRRGSNLREQDAQLLLDWAFQTYTTVTPRIVSLPMQKVWKGKEASLSIEVIQNAQFTIERRRAANLQWKSVIHTPLLAPVSKGDVVGYLSFGDTEGELHRVPIQAAQDVIKASWPKRLLHSIILRFKRD